MEPLEQRIEKLEAITVALACLSTAGIAAVLGDDAVPLIRNLADETGDIPDSARAILRGIADAAEGRQK